MEKHPTRLLEQVFGENRVQFEPSVRIGDEIPGPDLVVVRSETIVFISLIQFYRLRIISILPGKRLVNSLQFVRC